jgi:hypothetical protein
VTNRESLLPDARLIELAQLSQGGGYTSWQDAHGNEVVGISTYEALVDAHTELGGLILDYIATVTPE